MFLGYNTNGLAHHDLLDAVDLLADIGYRGIAVTLDHHALNPFDPELRSQLERFRDRLRRHGMASVVETGARFLLDPRTKHEPTLLTADATERARRIDFLCRAIDVAAELESDCVSLWSGILRDTISESAAFERLIDGLAAVVDHAQRRGVVIGFEPEPGMLIESTRQFAQLASQLPSTTFRLTIDIGHLHCLGEVPIPHVLRQFADALVNIHIEDMRSGVHEHLMFGEGEIDFPPILQALADMGYKRGLYVELSRHSHDGPNTARRAYEYLRPRVAAAGG